MHGSESHLLVVRDRRDQRHSESVEVLHDRDECVVKGGLVFRAILASWCGESYQDDRYISQPSTGDVVGYLRQSICDELPR